MFPISAKTADTKESELERFIFLRVYSTWQWDVRRLKYKWATNNKSTVKTAPNDVLILTLQRFPFSLVTRRGHFRGTCNFQPLRSGSDKLWQNLIGSTPAQCSISRCSEDVLIRPSTEYSAKAKKMKSVIKSGYNFLPSKTQEND